MPKTIDDIIDSIRNVSKKHNGNIVWKTEQVIQIFEKYRDYLDSNIDKDFDIYWHRVSPDEESDYLVKFNDNTYDVIAWKTSIGWQSDKEVSKWKRIID